MNIQLITDFSQHLDQCFNKVIKEECSEEKVEAIAYKCFPNNRMVCETTLREKIMERLEQEFESELRKETWKKIPTGCIESLRAEYCFEKPIGAANKATEQAWASLEDSNLATASSKSEKKSFGHVFGSIFKK